MRQVQKGKLFTVAAPSGAGKTSLVNALVCAVENLYLSISYTTRPPRAGEVDGVNYHFVDKTTFDDMIADEDFLEHATVFHHQYGTSNRWVSQQLEQGKHVILEIDWQGVRQIKQLFPGCVRIFILPPSLSVLRERLTARGQDSAEVVNVRVQEAKEEIAHYEEADHLLVNDDFDKTLHDLIYIVTLGDEPKCQDRARNHALAKALLGNTATHS